jgi:hypothetical protein
MILAHRFCVLQMSADRLDVSAPHKQDGRAGADANDFGQSQECAPGD